MKSFTKQIFASASFIRVHFLIIMFFPVLLAVCGQDPDFNFIINVNGGGYDYDLTIGFSSDASDKYDPGIDKYAPPPSPPGTFDVALGWNNDRWYSQIVHGDTSDLIEHAWNIQLQYPKNDFINLHWDNGCIAPLGTFILQDAFGGENGMELREFARTQLTREQAEKHHSKPKTPQQAEAHHSKPKTPQQTE